jgi:hypothetical protein
MAQKMHYKASDGKIFDKKHLYLQYQQNLNIEKLAKLNSTSWLERNAGLIILAAMVAIYVIGFLYFKF